MENTNFSLKIRRLPYSRLLKSEMADYVENTIAIVESHDVTSKLIKPLFEKLSVKTSDIKLLRLSYGVDTERLRVTKLKVKMMLVISAFKIQVRLLSKSKPELDMHVIQNAINKHLRYLDKCKNDKELSQKIAGFFDLVSTNAELQTKLDDFDLISKVDDMTSIYTQVEEALKNRVKVLSLRSIVATSVLVKGMSKAVDNLFKSIEVANMLTGLTETPEPGDQVELTPLIDELNQLSEMYALSISIRDANNKRKALKDKEGEEGGEGPSEPIVTARYFGNDADTFEGITSPFERMENAVDENDAEGLCDGDVVEANY